MRQICQFTVEFPIPEGLYFKDPYNSFHLKQHLILYCSGFPSIFVTYDVKTDFFFSGHTSLMVTSAIDMVRRTRSKVLAFNMILLCLFQMSIVLISSRNSQPSGLSTTNNRYSGSTTSQMLSLLCSLPSQLITLAESTDLS